MGNSKSKSHSKIKQVSSIPPATAEINRIYSYAQTNQYKFKIIPAKYLNSSPITLVTHCTFDRLQIFQTQVINWNGNVSVSIFLNKKQEKSFKKFIEDSEILNSRQYITYTLVYNEEYRLKRRLIEEIYIYPINFMRNLALQSARTNLVFLVDVDFIPNVLLSQHIIDYMHLLSIPNRALVIPAFEIKSTDIKFPNSKEELLNLIQNKIITTFHEENWSKGHEPTNYKKWMEMNEPYTIEWEPSYEPFIIVRKDQIPLFDRRFVGYGWDKVSHVMELAAIGFEFIVLPNDFIIHLPHEKSLDNQLFNYDQQFRTCFEQERTNFLTNLVINYGEINPVIKKYRALTSKHHVHQQNNTSGHKGKKYSKSKHHSGSKSTKDKKEKKDYIEAYKWSQLNQFKFQSFWLDNYNKSVVYDEIDVTLVTQLTMDRITIFEILCQRWIGPISVAFYINENELDYLYQFVQESITLSTRTNIGYHIVICDGQFYPINYLRNIALQNVQTNYNFLVDVDFLPCKNLYQNLREKIMIYLHSSTEEENNVTTKSKTCLVIPAFEMIDENNTTKFPETKDELLLELDSNKIIPFYENQWPTGHKPTNYKKWFISNEPYFVNWEFDYEPYIVIDKNVPNYDTSFVGYGWNKISHIMEVAANGYKFLVLHDSFIVHVSHPDSKDKIVFKTNPYFKKISKKTRYNFLVNFKRKYKHSNVFFPVMDFNDDDGDDLGNEWNPVPDLSSRSSSDSCSNSNSNGGGGSDNHSCSSGNEDCDNKNSDDDCNCDYDDRLGSDSNNAKDAVDFENAAVMSYLADPMAAYY